MFTVDSVGSPNTRRSNAVNKFDQENTSVTDDFGQTQSVNTLKRSSALLSSFKLSNQAVPKKMRGQDDSNASQGTDPMNQLLAKLAEQQASMEAQHGAFSPDTVASDEGLSQDSHHGLPASSVSSSLPLSPALPAYMASNAATRPSSAANNDPNTMGADEVARLKLELEKAQGKIARMDQELAQSRITRHTVTQAIGTPSETDFSQYSNEGAYGPRRPFVCDSSASVTDDGRSDAGEAAHAAGGFNHGRSIWNDMNGARANYAAGYGGATQAFPAPGAYSAGAWIGRGGGQLQPQGTFMEQGMPYAAQGMTFYGTDRRLEVDNLARRNGPGGRLNNARGGGHGFNGYTDTNAAGLPASMGGHIAMGNHMGNAMFTGAINYQPTPIGTPLTAHAPEFTPNGNNWRGAGGQGGVGSGDLAASEGQQTYLPTTEPLNYRRLLDRTISCDWKYIVDKIVCNNDQQASIFLQQKLKVGTAEQKYEIVESIVAQAYPLMVNRFGNFLVQRCFEHGTADQVIKIAEAIRGNTLNLSMDAFGCHVVQKAFDSVPEDYKSIMVHELLRRIPDTVVHRYACHVWQKLFELRWTESPPLIMKYVNEALRGMWHEVALGETGSLVVQNIFENCLEEDKRPCIEEVLASIDIVAHGQFGNWCIQHICEHGAPADRSRAIDHVIRYATEYSMDQFASKVVEKCLKVGGVDFLGRYLDRVCEGRHDRPRIPLIDIASDQYGNYLIQYILTHANPQHREMVASHIRKHMVSLRGSKFGSRVGMLCTNPAVATRPGPGVASGPPPVGSRGIPPRNGYGGGYR